MPKHDLTHHSPYTPHQLFQLVMDIEEYPTFLPWCVNAHIRKEHSREGLLGDLTIRFGPLSETYTSHVVGREPTPKHKDHTISIRMVEGPFSHLTNDWRFTPVSGGGTDIHFAIDFAFRSKLLDAMAGKAFAAAMVKMMDAFEKRAEELYGKK